MNILNPSLGIFRNGEYIRYMKDVITLCGNNNPVALKIDTQVNNLQLSIEPLNNLFMLERGNLLTPELQAADARRDAAVTGLRFAATAFTYHYEPETKNAATVVAAGIDKYGAGLARLNYIAETEVIESLVGDFANNTDMVAAADTLRLQNWVAEMNMANQAFNQLYITRTGDYASKPKGSLTEQRDVTTEAYNDLVAHIFSYQTLTKAVGYTKLIEELNSLTNQYNKVVESRGSGPDIEVDIDPAAASQTIAEVQA